MYERWHVHEDHFLKKKAMAWDYQFNCRCKYQSALVFIFENDKLMYLYNVGYCPQEIVWK